MLACNLAGPRRLKAGAARDHFLGLRAVTGRGEAVKAGGRVVKNVTGYDIMKLMAGSYGTLAALTEVTLKVLPAPEKTYSVLVLGLDDRQAVTAMSRALGSPHEVSSAAYLPAEIACGSGVSYIREAGSSVTALRLEGPGPSVVHRCQALRALLSDFGADGGTAQRELGCLLAGDPGCGALCAGPQGCRLAPVHRAQRGAGCPRPAGAQRLAVFPRLGGAG